MGLPRIILSTLSNYGRQLAFAMAPIPAYLPQYFALCNTNDPVLRRRKKLLTPSSVANGNINNKGSQSNLISSSNISISNNSNLNKKNQSKHNDHVNSIMINTGTSSIINNHTSTTSGTSINNCETGNYSLGGGGGNNMSSKQITEGGFSSTSIMILLLSHVFRLQYFFVSAILSTFYPVDNNSSSSSSESNNSNSSGQNNANKADRIHFDLVLQSFVMIGIQLLLLSAVTRRRRLSHKDKVDDDIEDLSSSLYQKSSSLSQKPFIWVYKPKQHWRWDTLNQHIELIMLILIFEYIVCRYYMYPDNVIDYIQAVKNISVLLESCLALPQMILNYRRKSTDGLSLLMVLGWVLGDLLKLAYFISSYYNNANDGSDNTNGVVVPHKEESASSDMVAFMIGSVFALGLDSIVMLQLIKWYPTNEYKNLQKRIKHSMLWKYIIRAGGPISPRRFSVDELSP